LTLCHYQRLQLTPDNVLQLQILWYAASILRPLTSANYAIIRDTFTHTLAHTNTHRHAINLIVIVSDMRQMTMGGAMW